jgi:hypothetical protein
MPSEQAAPKQRRKALERILAMGISGSGKTYNWLKLARRLKQTGAKFRVIDTDNAINYMLDTQFQDLIPENGGNVYVWEAFDWPEYKRGIKWIKQDGLTKEELSSIDKYLKLAYTTPIAPKDWVSLDMADNAWNRVQNHFIESVFGEDMGEYFLQIRKEVEKKGGMGKDGKTMASVAKEAMDGWKDWPVVNKLYDSFMLPIIYRVKCNVYMTTSVSEIDKKEKDAELLRLFGDLGLRPAGQKKIGHQAHTIFLMVPGKSNWYIQTVKDRAGRSYYPSKPRTKLTDFYNQYLVMKAGWDYLPRDPAEDDQQEAEDLNTSSDDNQYDNNSDNSWPEKKEKDE